MFYSQHIARGREKGPEVEEQTKAVVSLDMGLYSLEIQCLGFWEVGNKTN